MAVATLPQNWADGNGLNTERWTVKMVADRLEEAANTLRRLPVTGLKPKGYGRSWPDVISDAVGACDCDGPVIRFGPPPADAITRMDQAMEWLRWLEPDQVRLVWLRASRTPWKMIMRGFGISRSTASTRWNAAILQIVAILNLPNRIPAQNAGMVEKMSGHLFAGHVGQNLL